MWRATVPCICGILLCGISVAVWHTDALWALMVPLFTAGAGVFFVITVVPEDRIFTQDIRVAHEMFHLAMFLGGVLLGSALCAVPFLFLRLWNVPLGAIYFNMLGSTLMMISFPDLRKLIQSH